MKPGEPDPLEASLAGRRQGPITLDDWAGGIPQDRAKLPSVRIGRRWFSSLWLVPLGIVALVLSIAIVREMTRYGWYQDFIARYPGTSTDYVDPVDSGFPWWLRWQHFLNLLFMMFMIRAGLQILADHPRLYFTIASKPDTEWMRLRDAVPADRRDPEDPQRVWTAKQDSVALPKHVGLPGIRHTIGLARWWHFTFDLLWLINGVVFMVLLFSTNQWKRLIPTSWDVFPNAVSTALQYLSLQLPQNAGFNTYNALQLLAYFITVFIAAPLALVTGLLQAPGIAGRFGTSAGLLNRQMARTVHFGVLVWMLVFIVVHTVMVFVTGFVGNVNHITLGTDTNSYLGVALYLAWMAVVAAFWLVASPLTIKYPRTIQNIGKAMVGWLKKLLERSAPRATYSKDDISDYFWPNGTLPVTDEYRQLQAGNWSDYVLRVDGLVENPLEITYAELLALPKQDQITHHFCIQGWSAIGEWTGVPMRTICEMVKPLPSAKWVAFYSFAEGSDGGRYYDCHPIANMYHEQTILAYGLNGAPLNESHGAPVRLRDEVELGFKMVKWIEAIEFVESYEDLGGGYGGYNEDHEYYGFRMPI
ncbi:molybdopterin-dependent oxidoreductase [Mycolicibacterium sp.]|jgi:thiosulfate reductase cytochrome b subunit|uniref:molybdopterin-dependent oxidoreductase n=1 Tax=Mycolicibacterium sp. TaxID=2320850 RepID=UPI001A349A58|nr:molybdopterin-dependent oxidoreductase [Mycolicibacterium sp.]MBJ7400017.1 molybdopterin-dependent oxidoreductase [Mycolicibacterium sp.]